MSPSFCVKSLKLKGDRMEYLVIITEDKLETDDPQTVPGFNAEQNGNCKENISCLILEIFLCDEKFLFNFHCGEMRCAGGAPHLRCLFLLKTHNNHLAALSARTQVRQLQGQGSSMEISYFFIWTYSEIL